MPTNCNTIAMSNENAHFIPKVIRITSAYKILSTAKWSATAINKILDLKLLRYIYH